MKRMIGYSLFWVAVGILLMMVVQSIFIGIMLIITCLLISYSLFCCP